MHRNDLRYGTNNHLHPQTINTITDTLNENPESCTESDTPETDAEKFYSDYHGSYVCFAEHAEDLERERDEWKAVANGNLLGLIKERDEAIQERDEAVAARKASAAHWLDMIANADKRTARAKRERDEAASSCQIWQSGGGKLVEDRDRWKAEAERWRSLGQGWKEEAVEQIKEANRLVEGIRSELRKNAHLADGDDCTLIGLKQLIGYEEGEL